MGSYTVLEHIARFIANHLPRKVVYFTGIRIWSEATRNNPNAVAPTMKIKDALGIWEGA